MRRRRVSTSDSLSLSLDDDDDRLNRSVNSLSRCHLPLPLGATRPLAVLLRSAAALTLGRLGAQDLVRETNARLELFRNLDGGLVTGRRTESLAELLCATRTRDIGTRVGALVRVVTVLETFLDASATSHDSGLRATRPVFVAWRLQGISPGIACWMTPCWIEAAWGGCCG